MNYGPLDGAGEVLNRVNESLARMLEDRKRAKEQSERLADALRMVTQRINCCDSKARKIARDALKAEGLK